MVLKTSLKRRSEKKNALHRGWRGLQMRRRHGQSVLHASGPARPRARAPARRHARMPARRVAPPSGFPQEEEPEELCVQLPHAFDRAHGKVHSHCADDGHDNDCEHRGLVVEEVVRQRVALELLRGGQDAQAQEDGEHALHLGPPRSTLVSTARWQGAHTEVRPRAPTHQVKTGHDHDTLRQRKEPAAVGRHLDHRRPLPKPLLHVDAPERALSSWEWFVGRTHEQITSSFHFAELLARQSRCQACGCGACWCLPHCCCTWRTPRWRS
jgi:hypothetical protein